MLKKFSRYREMRKYDFKLLKPTRKKNPFPDVIGSKFCAQIGCYAGWYNKPMIFVPIPDR